MKASDYLVEHKDDHRYSEVVVATTRSKARFGVASSLADVWNVPVGDLTVQSRTRLEQRFVETDGDTGWRLREFVKTTVPLAADNRTFASVWDELFWDLNDTDWGQRAGFRQNRVFVGPGWFLDDAKKVSIEVGYLNQWVDRPGEDKMNHCLSIWFFVNF